MNIQFDKNKLHSICETNDISFLGVFGSYALGNQRRDSDIDLLIDFKKTKSLLEKGKVLVKLQDFFKKEVDLISRKNVKSSLRPFINKQLITLYGKK